MSSSADADEACTSCGKVEVDEVKLKKCTCLLVKYCSVGCQRNHRPQHKKECKMRLAELRDEKLFKQPDGSYLGECPICFLPLSLDTDKSTMMGCCSKFICDGCFYADVRANAMREMDGKLEHRCPFCREPVTDSHEECNRNKMKRVEANDPSALRELGKVRRDEGDYEGAFEYLTKAAALGDIESHYEVSLLYGDGKGVAKNKKKEIYHLEEAAIGGHHYARNNLGCEEMGNGRVERAVKHWIIAANLGYDNALNGLKVGFIDGFASKEDYATALRGHQAAVDATKSKQREEAYAFFDKCRKYKKDYRITPP